MNEADRWQPKLVLLVGLFGPMAPVAAGQDPQPAEPRAEAPKPEEPKTGEAKPEAPAPDDAAAAAVRAFMLGIMMQDEPRLRAVTLPADGFEWLLKGQKATGLQAIAGRAALGTMKFRHLRPGDEYTIPGGRKFVVRPGEVGDTRALLMPDGGPLPFRLQKVEGAWKVDARPVIAGRRVADAARAQAEAKAKAAAEPPK